MSTIQIKELSMRYGNTKALDNVSLTIEPNKIYGLLGRNGAGKTTLLNLLTNKIYPHSGDIAIDGESVFSQNHSQKKIYYMMEKNLFPLSLKIKEIFKWTKEFYPEFNLEYANSLAKKFGLDVSKTVKEQSTGYTSIFKAIVALASNARITIFDEPVLGLDANHREIFYKELLASYNDNPRTVIISTHLIEEVANVLEEVIIINAGRIILKKSVEELLSSAYTISGEKENVDKYLQGREYVSAETLGKFKSAIVLADLQSRDEGLAKKLELDFTKTELQQLFIGLTNS